MTVLPFWMFYLCSMLVVWGICKTIKHLDMWDFGVTKNDLGWMFPIVIFWPIAIIIFIIIVLIIGTNAILEWIAKNIAVSIQRLRK